MDIRDYQSKASRTMRRDEVGADGEPRFSVGSVCNFAMGLSGERGELTDEFIYGGASADRMRGELGDMSWYVAALCTLFDIDMTRVVEISEHVDRPIDTGSLHEMLLSLSAAEGKLVDHLKKACFHGHDFDFEEIEKALAVVWWHIPHLAHIFQLSVDDVLEGNIQKLMKRYPEGFSHERSRQREA